jgi:DNA repair protein RadD
MLRDYQEKAINMIREHYKDGKKKVLLHMDTGAGKTVIFSEIMKSVAAKNKKSLMAVRGRDLVNQAHNRLKRENVFHGVVMANHWAFNRIAPIQLCSIDTLRSRSYFPDSDLNVYDEVHYAISKSYHDFISHYEEKPTLHLGVTATPYVEKSLKHIAEVVVRPITMKQLIEQGYLVPAQYIAPISVDVSKVKISNSTKDYVVSDLEKILNENHIVGDAVENWKKFAENRPTILFAVSLQHSKHLRDTFIVNGIKAEHCDADTPDEEREKIKKRLESGETKVVCNVGIFCTGIDIPSVSCIQMCRPTQSYNLYIQQAGRGTRTFDGKKDFILLDNAGNVLRHGFIEDTPDCDLDGKRKNETPVKSCPNCHHIQLRFIKECQSCGFVEINNRSDGAENSREAIVIDGQLGKIENFSTMTLATIEYNQLKRKQKLNGYKNGWVFYKLKERFGEEIAQKIMPKKNIPDFILEQLREKKYAN